MHTILNRHGEVLEQGLSLDDAAKAILTYDGHEFEIRQDGDCFELWVSRASRNSGHWAGLTRSVIFAVEPDAEKAKKRIFTDVLLKADMWDNQRATTDARYAEELAEME